MVFCSLVMGWAQVESMTTKQIVVEMFFDFEEGLQVPLKSTKKPSFETTFYQHLLLTPDGYAKSQIACDLLSFGRGAALLYFPVVCRFCELQKQRLAMSMGESMVRRAKLFVASKCTS